MNKFSRILAILLAVVMLFALSACGTPFGDIANDAQQNAQDMADNIMNELDKWENFEQGVDDYFNDNDETTNTKSENTYKVIRVVDGDTFIVDINGTETKVRLIGVDTPESVATGDNAYKNCEEGKTASNFTKSLIEGKYVTLEYDVDPDDDYGRTLAYAYLEDGSMLNKTLLQKGYARLMTIQPNVKYVDDFTELQREARESKEGFWEDFDQWEE